MSYVRFGPNSDVYLYGSTTSLILHIAWNRGPAGNVPQPVGGDSEEAWNAYLDDVIPLDHPEAGGTFEFTRYSDCIEKLEELKAQGLDIPEQALARLWADSVVEGDEYK